LQHRLAQIKQACSATFYVPDPQWAGRLRLALMTGVVNTEPMYGLVYPHSAQDRLFSGMESDEATFFPEAVSDSRLIDTTDSILTDLIQQNPLFGNFVCRERVASSARFRRAHSDGSPLGVLWVNFSEPTEFGDGLKRDLAEIFSSLVERIPEIAADLEEVDPFPASSLTRILEATTFLTIAGRDLEDYLTAILDATLEAVGINPERGEGLGSVFRYDARHKTLVRSALRGKTFPNAQSTNDVSKGQGLISWVALRRRALLVLDLESSNFARSGIYIPVAPGIRSELAVPMLAGDQLVGVLNLESSLTPSPFKHSSVRAVWAAANQASIAYRIAQERDRTGTFLTILHEATSRAAGAIPTDRTEAAARPMNRLASLACDWLGAGKSEVWHYSSAASTVPTSVGSSYSDIDRSVLPRARGGFTEWVRLNQKAVWLSDIQSETEFKCHTWCEDGWHDALLELVAPLPVVLNRADINAAIRSQLGLPILVSGRCKGVVWLKFAHEALTPSATFMSTATAFAAGAGVVIDVLERQQDLARQQGLRAVAMDLCKKLFPTEPFKFRDVDGFVIYRPCEADLGGDFYAAAELDEAHSVFLIGDVVKHGTEAALRMLPIIANFKLVSRESRSSKNILQRLAPLSDELQLQASAMCFILDSRQPKVAPGLHLFMSNAGHPSLIIIRPDVGTLKQIPDPEQLQNVANSGWIGLSLNTPLGEEHHQLAPGDYIIAYSDGVSEAGKHADPIRMLGPFGISTVASQVINAGGGPQQVAEAIEAAAVERDSGMPRDDITVMVLRVNRRRDSTD
jgi:serine phosphatase RsbU (regulator of sigma subunit)/putative methionine-R-sulfoxide reductase with GAF domain